ncbi:phage tail fiber protein [Paenibacillus wenxiniae]|uniref:Bacteriophage lambda head decoration protein D n=1 Tax=Paenibacillus wenxiniae TaxID=1636843 RepID=A0ABW4RHQ0_9BACL
MAALTNYAEARLLNYLFRTGNVYVALYKTNPSDSNTGEEVSGGSYARQLISFGDPTQIADKGTIKNSSDVVFPVATAEWGTIAYVGVTDAATGGNLLAYKAVTNPRAVLISDRVRFLSNEFSVEID